MRIGNLTGKGEVYNNKGKPILQKGEKIIKKYKEKCSVSCMKEKAIGGWRIFEQGYGMFYLTNKRLIFIRYPLTLKERIEESGWYGGSVDDVHAEFIRQKGFFEFIEFKYEEIDEIKIGLLNGMINFFADGKIFTVWTKKFITKEIKTIMQTI